MIEWPGTNRITMTTAEYLTIVFLISILLWGIVLRLRK
jgi:hypothetical protein